MTRPSAPPAASLRRFWWSWAVGRLLDRSMGPAGGARGDALPVGAMRGEGGGEPRRRVMVEPVTSCRSSRAASSAGKAVLMPWDTAAAGAAARGGPVGYGWRSTRVSSQTRALDLASKTVLLLLEPVAVPRRTATPEDQPPCLMLLLLVVMSAAGAVTARLATALGRMYALGGEAMLGAEYDREKAGCGSEGSSTTTGGGCGSLAATSVLIARSSEDEEGVESHDECVVGALAGNE